MGRAGSRLSRRQFLAAAGSAGLGATLAGLIPEVVERAYAADPGGCGSLSDIEHFVFVMQENRSFDHYFGTLSGVRGFDDPRMPLQEIGGRPYPVTYQFGWEAGMGPTATGYTLPFAFRSDPTHDDQCLNDPTHDWGPQHQCWNEGGMDSFLSTHLQYDSSVGGVSNAPIVMSHYDRTTLPFYYDLADAFTVCDGYHCSVLGPTYPNRAYWMSRTLDPNGDAGGPILATLGDVLPDPTSWSYLRWKTMPEVLEEAGVSWKVYQSSDAIGGFQGGLLMDNILRLFKQYSAPGPLMEKGLLPTLELNFIEDVQTGSLPQVSWIVTDFSACEHPAAPPAFGGFVVWQILNYLTLNPAVWEKTAVIISYDENGGFFDHVPPPVAPLGTPGEYVTKPPPVSALGSLGGFDGPIGLGFRVPCLVVSPYSRGGLVYSGVSDHTSQLRLIETRFGTEVPNLSAWRRTAVGDLTGAFDFASRPDLSTALPAASLDPYMAADVAANSGPGTAGQGIPYPYPPNSIPHQEAGPPRRQPSGVVCAASSTAPVSTAAPPKAPTTTKAPTPGGTSGPGGAEGQLAYTGGSALPDAVRAAGLLAVGGAMIGLAGQMPDGDPDPRGR